MTAIKGLQWHHQIICAFLLDTFFFFFFFFFVDELVPLLEPVFLAVRALECDDAGAAAVVPELNELITNLKAQADVVDEPLTQMCLHSATIIHKRGFEKSGFLFQLADVLTPFGRHYTRNQIRNPHQHQITSPIQDEEHHPSAHFGFSLASDPAYIDEQLFFESISIGLIPDISVVRNKPEIWDHKQMQSPGFRAIWERNVSIEDLSRRRQMQRFGIINNTLADLDFCCSFAHSRNPVFIQKHKNDVPGLRDMSDVIFSKNHMDSIHFYEFSISNPFPSDNRWNNP
jgi:hypothetical protein